VLDARGDVLIRIPLPDDTSRDAVDDIALAAGLALLNILPRADTFPAQRVYATSDHRALVHLIEDGTLSWVVRAQGNAGSAMDVEERWAGVLRAAMEGVAS
jgi:hypothetical protein